MKPPLRSAMAYDHKGILLWIIEYYIINRIIMHAPISTYM